MGKKRSPPSPPAPLRAPRQWSAGEGSGGRCRVFPVSLLLFLPGLCALVYQVTWQREFRLVFGSSTAASGAVLAIFMGSLGLGNAWLGRRVDAQPRPLAFYARLELLAHPGGSCQPNRGQRLRMRRHHVV